jgi:hypothetical protein
MIKLFGRKRYEAPSESWYTNADKIESEFSEISAGPEITDVAGFLRTVAASRNVEDSIRDAVFAALRAIPTSLISTEEEEEISVEVSAVAKTLLERKLELKLRAKKAQPVA